MQAMDRKFIQEWIERGDKIKDEQDAYIHKFFCYYIAFNWLYDSARPNHREAEYKIIKRYIEQQIAHWENYNPYELLMSTEWKTPVKDARTGKVNSYINEGDKIIQLFMRIYQVRCNLFHGSKSMDTDRNRKLLQDSSIVIRDFLNRVIS